MVRSELPDQVAVATPHIDALTAADIGGGLALSDAAGWNQTGEDWAFFIGTGRAFGIRSDDGRLMATAASLGYGGRAWVSLVLVAAAARHRGLASALMARCIAQIERDGDTAVLDATPAGAEVYARLGFMPGFTFDRWEGPSGAGPAALAEAAQPAATARDSAVLDRIAALDAAAHGLDRRRVLASFLARQDSQVRSSSDGTGFVVTRAGRRAWQIGPVVASDEGQAVDLLRSALDGLSARPDDRVVVDVPSAHRQVGDALARRSFAVQRPFIRMSLGDDAAGSRLTPRVFALAGPEYG